MNILRALLSHPRKFAGFGVNHAGEKFSGVLVLQPLVNDTAMMLHYAATRDDGQHVHAEATLLGRDAAGRLCLWPVMEELPVVIAHVELVASDGEGGGAKATFATGPRDAGDQFREEITIAISGNGVLTYSHSWGMPQGKFEQRSSCEMVAQ